MPAVSCFLSVWRLRLKRREVSRSSGSESEPDIAGYRLFYGPTSGNYTQQIDVGNTTAATVSNLANGGTYFFVVTAYNTDAMESPPSNEVSATVGGGPTPTASDRSSPTATATPTATPAHTPTPHSHRYGYSHTNRYRHTHGHPHTPRPRQPQLRPLRHRPAPHPATPAPPTPTATTPPRQTALLATRSSHSAHPDRTPPGYSLYGHRTIINRTENNWGVTINGQGWLSLQQRAVRLHSGRLNTTSTPTAITLAMFRFCGGDKRCSILRFGVQRTCGGNFGYACARREYVRAASSNYKPRLPATPLM